MRSALLIAALLATTPAMAVSNLITNGSFEAGNSGTGGYTGWTKTNVPGNAPATIISYGNTLGYPFGAFGENVFADNAASLSPDAVGVKAAYFPGDFSVNETISQLVILAPGKYQVGFSYFLTQNGLNNVGNASFDARIFGVPIASTAINAASPARVWIPVTGVVEVLQGRAYDVAFTFNSNRAPSKDIVIDRVFAFRTDGVPTFTAPPTSSFVPEPGTWAMLIAGFGLVGTTARRRRRIAVVTC